jgi:hypothetical protein
VTAEFSACGSPAKSEARFSEVGLLVRANIPNLNRILLYLSRRHCLAGLLITKNIRWLQRSNSSIRKTTWEKLLSLK